MERKSVIMTKVGDKFYSNFIQKKDSAMLFTFGNNTAVEGAVSVQFRIYDTVEPVTHNESLTLDANKESDFISFQGQKGIEVRLVSTVELKNVKLLY